MDSELIKLLGNPIKLFRKGKVKSPLFNKEFFGYYLGKEGAPIYNDEIYIDINGVLTKPQSIDAVNFYGDLSRYITFIDSGEIWPYQDKVRTIFLMLVDKIAELESNLESLEDHLGSYRRSAY